MNEALVKALSAYLPQIAAIVFSGCLGAILLGVYAGMRMRGRILTEAAEGILSTVQFQDAAKVQAEKAIRSVSFVEGVQRAVRDDVRTQSGIIDVVLTSPEIRDYMDRRVQHGTSNFGYVVDAKIRDVQEQIRREAIESNARVEEKVQQVLELLLKHMENASR